MVRTREDAVAAVTARTVETVSQIATLLDKEIDSDFTGSNSVPLVDERLAVEAVRTEIQLQYEAAGWAVTVVEAPPDTWTITVT